MHDPTTRFISQMKLRELRGHRARLDARYDELEATLSTEPDVDALIALYEALDGMRFAGSPLHPELEHLGHVFEVFARRAPESDVLNMWYDRVRHSLERGRARARWVEIFGEALAELASAPAPSEHPPAEASLQLYLRPPPGRGTHREALRTALSVINPSTLDRLRAPWASFGDEEEEVECPLRQHVEPHEVSAALSDIANDTFRHASQRAAATRFHDDGALTKELADALSLQLAHLDGWSWSGEVDTHVVRMRERWRVQLEEDLPTACLLEILGARLGDHLLDTLEGTSQSARVARLERLITLKAPKIIIDNERRMLEAVSHRRASYDVGVWEDTLGVARSKESLDPSRHSTYGTITAIRKSWSAELGRVSMTQGYGADGDASAADSVLGWVHAEVELARAAWPEHPVWVVKLDIEDFFPSLHHPHLLSMLESFGLPDELLDVFSRILAVPTPSGAWTRGVPVGRCLSHALAELLMHLLERRVKYKVPVRIIRLVDDVCFMSPSREHAERAWETALEFLEAFDLRPNASKCGALGLNTSEVSSLLPAQAPRWGVWEMSTFEDAHGTLAWRLNDAHLDAVVSDARAQVESGGALLESVRTYGELLSQFERGLAMRLPLDSTHRAAVGEALERFEAGVFGEQGPLEWCRARLDEGSRGALTESLLHWPITAGGLGLRHAHARAARAERAWRSRRRVTPPQERGDAWEVDAHEWGRFFEQWADLMDEPHVQASAQMEALILDFIQRGSEVGGRHQRTLDPYWRTIVQMYGPQLLERFGTFRFVLTELVPLRLITHGSDGLGDDLVSRRHEYDDVPF